MYVDLLRRTSVQQRTADAIAALYDRLYWEAPPDTWPAQRARRRAAALGYPPPQAWDDDAIDDPVAQPVGLDPEHTSRPARLASNDVDWVAVDRVVERGRKLDPDLWATMTGGERRAVVARLLELRWSQSQIGDHLRISGTTLADYLPARTEVAA